MNKKIGWLAIALASVGFTGIAAAQPGPDCDQGGPSAERRTEALKKYDANQNGKLDPDERQALRDGMRQKFEARRAEMLKKYDANADGKLDQAERDAMRADFVKERFAKLDTNHDGSLSLAEFQAAKPPADHFGPHRFGRHHHGHGRGMDHQRPAQDKSSK